MKPETKDICVHAYVHDGYGYQYFGRPIGRVPVVIRASKYAANWRLHGKVVRQTILEGWFTPFVARLETYIKVGNYTSNYITSNAYRPGLGFL